MAAHGYVATTAAGIYGRAGVSSRAFYEQFDNKEECFLAAYDAGVGTFIRRVKSAWLTDDTAPVALDRLSRLLQRYLDSLSRDQSLARAFLVEIYAVERALQSRESIQQRFVSLVEEALGARTPEGSPDRFATEAFVAAITFLVTARVATREYRDLAQLHRPLMSLAHRFFGEIPS